MNQTAERNILIVDDNRFARTILKRILATLPQYKIVEAASGEEALKIISQRPHFFHAFLLDIEMPGMDGLELSKRIREIKTHQHTPILMVTALDEGRKLRDCFSYGANDFVNKPLDPIIVHARLNNLLERVDTFAQLEQVKAKMERMHQSLLRYVSPYTQMMVEKYLENDQRPQPEEKVMCVLFSDLRSFTAATEEVPPQLLFDSVSAQLGIQVETVYQYHGYVDKFSGDGIMAVFEGSKGAENACLCALEIIDKARTSSSTSTNEEMAVGIGIHRGPVIVGNIGQGEHLDYSVIGRTVNIAARLCERAGLMDILVSEAIVNDCRQKELFRFANTQQVSLRGLDGDYSVYNLLPPLSPDSFR
jgi:adenylate cyclase